MAVVIGDFEVVSEPRPPAATQASASTAAPAEPDPAALQRALLQLHEEALRLVAH